MATGNFRGALEMFKKVKELSAEMEALGTTLEETESEVAKQLALIKEKEGKAQEMEDTITQLRAELSRCTSQLGNIETQCEEDDTGAQTAAQTLEALLARQQELVHAVKNTEETAHLAITQNEALATELKALQETQAAQEKELGGGESKVLVEFRAEIQEKQDALCQLQDTAAEAKQDLSALHQELSDTQRKTTILQADQSRLQSAGDNVQERLQKMGDELKKKTEELRKVRDGGNSNAGIGALTEQLKDLEAALAKEEDLRRQQNSKQQYELDKLRTERTEMETKVDGVVEAQEAANKDFAHLSRHIMKLKLQLREVRASNSNDDLVVLNNELSMAQRNSLLLKEEISALQRRKDKLEHEALEVEEALNS